MACDNKTANVWVARAIPLILLGIIGYSSWVFTRLIGVNYLINPSPDDFVKSRAGLGAALIAIFYILLFPTLVCYLRLIQVIEVDPGFVDRGRNWNVHKKGDLEKDRRGHKRPRTPRSSTSRRHGDPLPWTGTPQSVSSDTGGTPYTGSRTDRPNEQMEAGLEDWWTKEVFVCQFDGVPAWCSTCLNFKPDRAHHCREVQRCVRKMDHFCPWVGGIISETSFKFFAQFVSYAFVFCTYAMVVVAVFTAERHRKTGNYNVHWVLVVALAALFGLFGGGMSASSIQLALSNTTTIENLSKRTSVWYLAIHINRPGLLPQQANPNSPPLFRTITFPLSSPRADSPDSPSAPPAPTQNQPPRTFAILESRRGDNIFDLGSPLLNFKEVMGHNVLDWLLPFTRSPCTDHSHGESAFKLGPAVQRMKEEAGLVPYIREDSETSSGRRRHKRRRRRHTSNKDVDGKYVENGRRKQKHRPGSRGGGPAGVLR